MALKVGIEQTSGIAPEYWKIVSVELDYQPQTPMFSLGVESLEPVAWARIVLLGFLNVDMRTAGKDAVCSNAVSIPIERIDGTDANIRSAVYAALKNFEPCEYYNSEDC